MVDTITCPRCGETYELINAYRECPWFHSKVNVLSGRHGLTPIQIMESKHWKEDVDERLLGL